LSYSQVETVLEFFQGKIGELWNVMVYVGKLKYQSFETFLRASISAQFQNHGINDLIPLINNLRFVKMGYELCVCFL
jgi:hypothetical protein